MTAADSITITATDADTGARIDKFLAQNLTDLSRARLQDLIQQGLVKTSDGSAIDSNKYKVSADEEFKITIPATESLELIAEDIPLKILYEDDDLIVLNKPIGLSVHPAPGFNRGTLVNALLHHCGDSLSGINGVERPGIVHRLDKDTSGVMVVAKTDTAHHSLSEQFSKRTITRHYHALVYGLPNPSEGEINAPIGRHPKDRKKMAVVEEDQGKVAITQYATLQRFATDAALIQCKLLTGRTHQIRVHMAHAGYPIVGDPSYGRAKPLKNYSVEINKEIRSLKRQLLHAAELGFIHPSSGEELFFKSTVPADFQAVIARLQ